MSFLVDRLGFDRPFLLGAGMSLLGGSGLPLAGRNPFAEALQMGMAYQAQEEQRRLEEEQRRREEEERRALARAREQEMELRAAQERRLQERHNFEREQYDLGLRDREAEEAALRAVLKSFGGVFTSDEFMGPPQPGAPRESELEAGRRRYAVDADQLQGLPSSILGSLITRQQSIQDIADERAWEERRAREAERAAVRLEGIRQQGKLDAATPTAPDDPKEWMTELQIRKLVQGWKRENPEALKAIEKLYVFADPDKVDGLVNEKIAEIILGEVEIDSRGRIFKLAPGVAEAAAGRLAASRNAGVSVYPEQGAAAPKFALAPGVASPAKLEAVEGLVAKMAARMPKWSSDQIIQRAQEHVASGKYPTLEAALLAMAQEIGL